MRLLEAWDHSGPRFHDAPKCLPRPEMNTPESAPQPMMTGLKHASLSRGGVADLNGPIRAQAHRCAGNEDQQQEAGYGGRGTRNQVIAAQLA
jgi:hypothetical protein